jgi:hypothetical protein
MAIKINSNVTLNKRRTFLLYAAVFTVSVFSIGRFIRRQLGKIAPDISVDDSEQLTKNIIRPFIHPLAVPRSKENSK